jgi:hypothetical protein
MTTMGKAHHRWTEPPNRTCRLCGLVEIVLLQATHGKKSIRYKPPGLTQLFKLPGGCPGTRPMATTPTLGDFFGMK